MMLWFIFTKGVFPAVLDNSHSSLFSGEKLVTLSNCSLFFFFLPWLSKHAAYTCGLQFFLYPILDPLQFTFCLAHTAETAPDSHG